MKLSQVKIIQDTSYLLGSSIVSRFSTGLAGIVSARILGPSDYGLLKIINYIPSLIKYGSFGFGSVTKREIPHLRGSKQNKTAENIIRNVSFSSDIIWSILLSIIIIIISLFYDRPEIKYGLWIVSITLLIRSFNNLYNISLSVDKQFSVLAIVGMMTSIVISMIILTTVYWGGIYSILGAGLLGGVFSCFLYSKKTNLDFSFSITKNEFYRQLKIALPLAGVTIAYGMFGWLQRLQVSALFGNEFLGYYMFLIFIIQTISIINNTFLKASVIELYERLGKGVDRDSTRSFVLKPSIVLGLVLPILGSIVWLTGAHILNIILPAYKSVNAMFPFLIPILVFEGISVMPRTSMRSAALNMQTKLMYLWLFSTFCFGLLTFIIGYKYENGLLGVIISRTTVSFLIFCISYIITFKYFFRSITDMIFQVFEMLLPSILMILFCLFLIKFVGIESIGKSLISVFLLIVLISPIFYVYVKRLKLIMVIKSLVK